MNLWNYYGNPFEYVSDLNFIFIYKICFVTENDFDQLDPDHDWCDLYEDDEARVYQQIKR